MLGSPDVFMKLRGENCTVILLREKESNLRPLGYEPSELPSVPSRDVLSEVVLRCKVSHFLCNMQRISGLSLMRFRTQTENSQVTKLFPPQKIIRGALIFSYLYLFFAVILRFLWNKSI